MFARFYEGHNTLPGNARDIQDYYDHLKAPVRVLETSPRGQSRAGTVQVARYVESSPDHLAHAENYCAVAMSAPARTGTVSGRVVSRRQVEEMLG
jgi:hypothetical protein